MFRPPSILWIFLLVGQTVSADEAVAPIPPAPQPRPVASQPPASPKVAVLNQKLKELAQLQREIRQLQTETQRGQQIIVRVQMLEVSLSKLKNMGLDVSTLESGSANVDDVASLARAVNSLGSNSAPYGQGQKGSNGTQALLDLLARSNVAKELANPLLMTTEGTAASLKVGPDIPIPAETGSNAVADFPLAGIQLDVLPTALGDNRVRLNIKVKVSEADYDHPVDMNGSRIPAINVRQCDTSVETSFDRSVVLGGLVETRTRPITTDQGVHNESEEICSILVVTPELVESPATAGRPNAAPISR